MNELTTVPIDVLLVVLGGLGGIIYKLVINRIDGYHKDNTAQIASLHKDNKRRATIQAHMQSYQRLICDKLGIEYEDPPADNED